MMTNYWLRIFWKSDRLSFWGLRLGKFPVGRSALTENNIINLRKKIEDLENQLPGLEEEIAKRFSDFNKPEKKAE